MIDLVDAIEQRNAQGIAEMSGNFEGEPEKIMVALDAVGNTTKAVTKGFAIGTAVIAAVALFASFVETIGEGTVINIAEPKTFIGAIIGGAIAASQAQAQQNAAYCSQRYRSYDPASGTYLNRDGNRYPCP